MTRGKLIVIGLLVLIVAVVGVRISKALPTTPPGVAAQNWRPLTEDVGIALQADRGPAQQGPMIGTLMVRDGDRWRTVELMPGAPRAVPAQ
jgi:hypothetical protein